MAIERGKNQLDSKEEWRWQQRIIFPVLLSDLSQEAKGAVYEAYTNFMQALDYYDYFCARNYTSDRENKDEDEDEDFFVGEMRC